MNREIKFRGKSSHDGNWLYGSFFKGLNDYIYIRHEVRINNHSACLKDEIVHPESVGQYTGLKDKNGAEVYEGDIVSRWGNKYTVIWDQERLCFRMVWSKEDTVNRYPDEDCEMIGNTHQNPDLLKQ